MNQPASITGVLTEILHQWYVRVESASQGAGHFIGKRVCVSPNPRISDKLRLFKDRRVTLSGSTVDDTCMRVRDVEDSPR